MADVKLHTDGNEVAGLLSSIVVGDVTTMMRTCQSCGDHRAIGEHMAYHGAAVVLRCPGCEDVAVRIARREDGSVLVEWRGTYVIA